MTYTMRLLTLGILLYLTIFSTFSLASTIVRAQPCINSGSILGSGSPQQMPVNYTEIASEAFIYGYPLITMYITERVATNVPAAIPNGAGAPVNQFALRTKVLTSNFTTVVTPSANALYATAFLDVSKEPVVLSVPDMGGLYHLLPLYDMWTDVFASIGTPTTGNRAGNFLIDGPTWKGTVPAGMTEIKSPTGIVWILGAMQANSSSTADVAAVNALQAQYKLTPLSAWGTNYTPPASVPVDPSVDMKTPPEIQVNNMANDPAKYFGLMAQLMIDNPPYAADAPMVANLAQIGIVPGQPFKWTGFTADGAKPDLGRNKSWTRPNPSPRKNRGPSRRNNGGERLGQRQVRQLHEHTHDESQYLRSLRVAPYVAYIGLGANLSNDETILQSGYNYSGQNNYVLHFDPGQTPPQNTFWTLTMYNNQSYFASNPINRYAIGNRNSLQFNPDGSLDIYIQNADPGPSKDSNWLPAPNGTFHMILRIYAAQSALNGTWVPPPVTLATSVVQSSTSTETMSTPSTSSTATPGTPGFPASTSWFTAANLQTEINLIFAALIFISGLWAYNKKKIKLALYVGLGFGLFAITWLLTLLGVAGALALPVLVLTRNRIRSDTRCCRRPRLLSIDQRQILSFARSSLKHRKVRRQELFKLALSFPERRQTSRSRRFLYILNLHGVLAFLRKW